MSQRENICMKCNKKIKTLLVESNKKGIYWTLKQRNICPLCICKALKKAKAKAPTNVVSTESNDKDDERPKKKKKINKKFEMKRNKKQKSKIS